MKILIYSTNFFPEQTGIGKYSGEMAFWLAEQGHEVRVICAPPYYPEWKIKKGYGWPAYSVSHINNVEVWRCPIWVPKEQNGLNRVLHLITFAISSFPIILLQLFWRPNVVFNVAPAFVCAPAGLLLAKLTGAKSWLHFQDFEVDIAFGMGFLKNKFLKKIITGFERFIINRFDKVSTISSRMMDKLSEKGVDKSKQVLFPNWVDLEHIFPLYSPSPYRAELGIDAAKKVFMFSGSMGGKQGLSIIPKAAKALENREDILFVLCGDGAIKQDLIKLCLGLNNVMFLPLQPFDRLGELLGLADVHLLTQNTRAEDLVLPSKLSGMLASGRPILATCDIKSQIGQIVENCGIVVEPENLHDLTNAIIILADNADLRMRFGVAARKNTERMFDKNFVLSQFLLVSMKR